jgi:L-methionine (R)-S-oxide reductase
MEMATHLQHPTPPDYGDLARRLAALVAGEPDWLPNLSNAAALIGGELEAVSWAGFYLARGGELVLGPFSGRPACVRIPFGQGVCGTAFARRETLIVADVDAFPGHIACDPDSRSEIVLPLVQDGVPLGVLDLDSHRRARFGDADAAGLRRVLDALTANCRLHGAVRNA